jgi:hypothetical protein
MNTFAYSTICPATFEEVVSVMTIKPILRKDEYGLVRYRPTLKEVDTKPFRSIAERGDLIYKYNRGKPLNKAKNIALKACVQECKELNEKRDAKNSKKEVT